MYRGAHIAVIVFFFAAFPMPAQAFTPSDVARSVYCFVQNIFGNECVPVHSAAKKIDASAHTASTISALQTTEVLSQETESNLFAVSGTAALPVSTEVDVVVQSDLQNVISLLEGKISSLNIPLAVERTLAAAEETRRNTAAFSQEPSDDYGAQIDSLWRALSLTNDIDNLGGVTLTTPTIANPTLSGTATSETLTVSGAFTASTTEAVVYDKGGHVCNVKAYGAVGDDSTDNYTAITNAIADCSDAGIVLFPPGVYRISQTIVLDAPITLQGTYAPRWSYSSTPRTSIKPMTPFTGTSIVHIRDASISGAAAANNGGRFKDISIDGNSYGTDVDGLHFEGLVRDWKIENVDISQTSGDGFKAEEGTGSGNPRGFTVLHLSIYSPESHGFRATALNDSYLEDVLVVGGAQRGFYLSSMGETKINNSRAVFNALEGLYIDGSTSNGGLQFTDFSTDRNDRHGVRISATGTTTIAFNGLLTRRDGENGNGGTETPYAGVALIGTSGNKVAPVVITGLSQIPGVDDGGGGSSSPATGLRAEYTEYVSVDGVLWGTTNAYTDDGNNDNFIIKEDALLKTGYASVTSALYNQKWIATSSELSYSGGNVGVGTTTPSAQLHTTGTVRFANFGSGTLQTDANGNVSVSSDERLKDIQGVYTLGLDEVLGIEPILYNWNEESGFDTETLYAGFSAQNIASVLPEAVGEDKHGLLTLSDRPILAAVVTAVKELWETVTGNTEEIEFLKARIESLEAALDVEPVTPVVPEAPEEDESGTAMTEDDEEAAIEAEDEELLPEEDETSTDEEEQDNEEVDSVEEETGEESIEEFETTEIEEAEEIAEETEVLEEEEIVPVVEESPTESIDEEVVQETETET